MNAPVEQLLFVTEENLSEKFMQVSAISLRDLYR